MPIFLLLSIQGMPEPVVLPLSLVTSKVMVWCIGPTGPISIVPIWLVRRVGTYGGIIFLWAIFNLSGICLLRVILKLQRLSGWEIVIRHGGPVWQHRRGRHWTGGPGWLLSVLLGKILIHPSDHSPTTPNRIFPQLPLPMGSQIQIP